MSAATVKKLPDEPIVIVSVSGSVADLSDSERDHAQMSSVLNAVSKPVFFIFDMSSAQIDVDNVLLGSRDAYFGAGATLKHPNIREVLLVSNNPLLELASKGLDSELFGNIKVQRFQTLDEALGYARAAR